MEQQGHVLGHLVSQSAVGVDGNVGRTVGGFCGFHDLPFPGILDEFPESGRFVAERNGR